MHIVISIRAASHKPANLRGITCAASETHPLMAGARPYECPRSSLDKENFHAGPLYEELEIGAKYKHAWTRTVTETDMVLYCGVTMNPAPLHLDQHYTEGTSYGQRLVPNSWTAGAIGGDKRKRLGPSHQPWNLKYSNFDLLNPVFLGGTLRANTTIPDKRKSRNRSASGIVLFEYRAEGAR